MTVSPKTLTITNCHALLDTLLSEDATQKQFRKNIRNYTIACLMLEAGLRVGEVVRLRISDLWFQGSPVKTIIIRAEISKSKREREIPVSTRLANAIEQMHKTYWAQIDEFVNYWAFSQGTTNKPITTRQIERILKQAGLDSIGKPIHPHMLRHTFASRLMRKTNSRIVQELLGHKHLTSTQIYMSPNGDDLRKAIDELDEKENVHEL